jgi:hypothetical protein
VQHAQHHQQQHQRAATPVPASAHTVPALHSAEHAAARTGQPSVAAAAAAVAAAAAAARSSSGAAPWHRPKARHRDDQHRTVILDGTPGCVIPGDDDEDDPASAGDPVPQADAGGPVLGLATDVDRERGRFYRRTVGLVWPAMCHAFAAGRHKGSQTQP